MDDYLVATSEPFYNFEFINSLSFSVCSNVIKAILVLCNNKSIYEKINIDLLYIKLFRYNVFDLFLNQNYSIYHSKNRIYIKYIDIDNNLSWTLDIINQLNNFKIILSVNCNKDMYFMFIPNLYLSVFFRYNNKYYHHNSFHYNYSSLLVDDCLRNILYTIIKYNTPDDIRSYYDKIFKK